MLTRTTQYKVLLQYYSVLQSTTLYYKVLLQYYSHGWSASPMKLYLHYAEQQRCFSNITECCACHAKWLSWLIRITYETLFTMSGATEMSLQHHQILRLPRKVTRIIDPLHTWNAIYNARSNKSQPPNSPNAAPAAKWISSLILFTHETLFTMRGATSVIVQTHQILRLPRKMTVQNLKEICWKRMKRHFQCAADPSMIRAWSENDPRMKPSVRNPPRNRGYLSRPPRAFCIEKCNISRSGYHSKFHRILRLPRKVTLELHQILRLPRKMNLMIDPCHTWNAIYNARSNKCHCPNSPNAAPATKNESHHWSSSHMKRYLQCAEQQVSLSKLTKYCACHEKWPSRISKKFAENGWNVMSNARPIRAWSENDPRMKPSVRNPPRNRGYLSRPPRAFCIEKYNISRSGYHSKFHRILRLPRKVTLELHQILRLPRKMNLMIDPRSNKCHCPNSPNAAPATKNESHHWSSSHMKRYLQ